MKITIKINYNQLTEVIDAIQQDRIAPIILTYGEKARNYLFNDAFKKLLKLQINKADADKKKPFTVKFTYAEALALWQNLILLGFNNEYRMAVLTSVKNNIHKQL